MLLSTFAGWAAETPRSWQSLQMPTAEEVRAHWTNPAPEYGPQPYYGLNGPVTLDTVRHDLDTMQALGFRAVTVQYGYGSDRAYLSPEYLQFFRELVLEAKRRDMRVWIVDDAGYPAGFAGGKFTAERPALRMQALVATSRTHVAAGATFDQDLTPGTVAVTATQTDGSQSIAVPLTSDHVHWIAPEGAWTVSVVEHVYRTSPTRSETNPHRVKDEAQSLEDYLDPAATAQFLAFTHEAYKRVVGDEFGKTILGFRGDEPDYSIDGLPWTPHFFEQFKKAKGYDVRPFLAALLQPGGTQQLRVRADYYDVFANLFRDAFFKPQAVWCAANGLEYQVHLNHEEQQLSLAQSEGDFFRDMRFVQVPGIDSIWHQIWTDTVSDFPRFASSAAHVYGHPRAFTESFAAYRPMPDLTMARYILNEQFARGINLVEAMYFPATSTPGQGGPMPFMQDPGFPDLMHYTSRLSYLMSMGRPAAEVALLLPAESLWMDDRQSDTTFVSTERLLSEHQVDFDIVGEDAIASELKLDGGSFLSGSGNRYRTILIPAADLLPAAVVDRLRSLIGGGGHVVFLGKSPSLIADSTDLHARPATAADFSWATTLAYALPPTPTPPAQPPASAPAPLSIPAGLLSGLEAALPQAALSLSTPNTALRYTHRVLKDADVFLLFNESAAPLQADVLLRAPGLKVEVWDPQTGAVSPASGLQSGPGKVLPITLAPYATKVLVVR